MKLKFWERVQISEAFVITERGVPQVICLSDAAVRAELQHHDKRITKVHRVHVRND